MAEPFAACIFDMDGVLSDSMRQHHLAYVRVLAPYNVEVPRSAVYEREGMNARAVIRDILNGYGLPLSDADAQRLGAEKQATFRALGRPPLVRGAERALAMLRQAGLPLGLVTGSTRENAAHNLGGLTQSFAAIVADGDYTRSKPDPEPYLVGAQRLGAKPDRCVVVENAPLGVRSAVAAGATCIALPTTMPVERLRAAGAHRVAGGLEEAAAMVLQGKG